MRNIPPNYLKSRIGKWTDLTKQIEVKIDYLVDG